MNKKALAGGIIHKHVTGFNNLCAFQPKLFMPIKFSAGEK
jgi:hypothetical protein